MDLKAGLLEVNEDATVEEQREAIRAFLKERGAYPVSTPFSKVRRT